MKTAFFDNQFELEPPLATPILFLIFNRPDVTQKVFSEIKRARPTRLYIAADGARTNKPGEISLVEQTRALILDNIDWDCKVETLFRESNLGCRNAVSSAITWFFENEEAGIILEDDCLPDQSFFWYCQELLDFYRDDKRVMVISGDNYQQDRVRGEYSYYFSQIAHIWGWASWRRAWRLYQQAVDHFEEIMRDPTNHSFTHNIEANQMWTEHFTKAYLGEIDSWAFLWAFANMVNRGLTILPNVNLVQNIGFSEGATHTSKWNTKQSVAAGKIKFPLAHPSYMIYDWDADNFSYKEFFNVQPRWRKVVPGLKRRLKDLFKITSSKH